MKMRGKRARKTLVLFQGVSKCPLQLPRKKKPPKIGQIPRTRKGSDSKIFKNH
jgi:hypothetical protein